MTSADYTDIYNHAATSNYLKTVFQGGITTSPRPFNILIQSIIQSNDKLFFIAYNCPNENRKEWKLVQLDFSQSMKKHSSCLQDGKFIVNFLIMHPKDTGVWFQHKRYWIEYHKIQSLKRLHKSYHLLQPSDISVLKAEQEELVPYREWINFTDSDTIIHGPFNFATLNNRQTRDRIDLKDWQILAKAKNMYHNEPPSPLKAYPIQIVHLNDPLHLIDSLEEVDQHVSAFEAFMHLEIDDCLDSMFGGTWKDM